MKKYKVLIFNPFSRETTWQTVYASNLDNAIRVAKYQIASNPEMLMCDESLPFDCIFDCLVTMEAKEV